MIWDNSGATGTADIDAVCVIQHAGSVSVDQPTVELSIDAQGYLVLRIEDPNGAADLDGNSIHCSFNGAPIGPRLQRIRAPLGAERDADGERLRAAVERAVHGDGTAWGGDGVGARRRRSLQRGSVVVQ